MGADESVELQWVDDARGLESLLERLKSEPRIAFDTESNSMHAYFERVCLVQVSVPGLDVLVDALAVDIQPLGDVLADPKRQKVFHGADYDVLSLKRAYGFVFENLFDTMLAARVLGWDKYGLAAILDANFGVAVNKKYQRYDWGTRPLDERALEYARLDTHYLLRLCDLQYEQLNERDRVDECLHACLRQARVEPRERPFDPNDFWKVKGIKDLSRRQQAVVRSLFVFRDQLARKKDRPPFRIMGDGVIVYLAQRCPKDRNELAKVKGLPRPVLHRHAGDLLAALREGEAADLDAIKKPVRARTPKDVSNRFDKLRSWRKDVASERGVEPDIVMGKDSLMALAVAHPTTRDQLGAIAEVDDWERERYGDDLLTVLTGQGPRPDGDRPEQ